MLLLLSSHPELQPQCQTTKFTVKCSLRLLNSSAKKDLISTPLFLLFLFWNVLLVKREIIMKDCGWGIVWKEVFIQQIFSVIIFYKSHVCFIFVFINICKANPILCLLYLIESLNESNTISSLPSNVTFFSGNILHRYTAAEFFENCG